jgi:YHS domain-containing protein
MQFGNVLYFLMWAAIFFFMMRYGCGAHVMGHAHHEPSGDGSGTAPEKAIDPVCGMTVDAEDAKAKSAVYRGRPYYFCSNSCRDKFEAAPTSYLHPSLPHEDRSHGS